MLDLKQDLDVYRDSHKNEEIESEVDFGIYLRKKTEGNINHNKLMTERFLRKYLDDSRDNLIKMADSCNYEYEFNIKKSLVLYSVKYIDEKYIKDYIDRWCKNNSIRYDIKFNQDSILIKFNWNKEEKDTKKILSGNSINIFTIFFILFFMLISTYLILFIMGFMYNINMSRELYIISYIISVINTVICYKINKMFREG